VQFSYGVIHVFIDEAANIPAHYKKLKNPADQRAI